MIKSKIQMKTIKIFKLEERIISKMTFIIKIGSKDTIKNEYCNDCDINDPSEVDWDWIGRCRFSNKDKSITLYITNDSSYSVNEILDHEFEHFNTRLRKLLAVTVNSDEMYVRYFNWLKNESELSKAWVKPYYYHLILTNSGNYEIVTSDDVRSTDDSICVSNDRDFLESIKDNNNILRYRK